MSIGFLLTADSEGNCCDCDGREAPCDPCDDVTGACCDEEGACTETTRSECEEAGGVFLPEEVCDPNPCNDAVCPCPGGLSAIYCVPDVVVTGPTQLELISPCHWCGYTEASEDDRLKFDLTIGDDPYPPFDRGCGWIITFDDGVNLYFKEWDGGNPIGTYDDNQATVGHLSIAECGEDASPSFPCGEARIATAHKQKSIGLGDVAAKFATPIARVLKMKCIDPKTKQLKPESKCAKRKKKLNKIRLN